MKTVPLLLIALALPGSALACDPGRFGNQQTPALIEAQAAQARAASTEAIAQYRALAEAGDAAAAYHLGMMLGSGCQGQPDAAQARQWMLKAAEQGHADAQKQLAQWHQGGLMGLRKNKKQARQWLDQALASYRRAGEAGDAGAYTELGRLHDDDGAWSGLKNHATAAEWYMKAANAGDALGQFRLGECYEQGKGLPLNDVQAAVWYIKANRSGHPEAAQALERVRRISPPRPR